MIYKNTVEHPPQLDFNFPVHRIAVSEIDYPTHRMMTCLEQCFVATVIKSIHGKQKRYFSTKSIFSLYLDSC